jgi:hypothetical protein
MPKYNRRNILKSSAAVLGGALLGRDAEAEQDTPVKNVNTHSSPSTLKITDLRIATVVKPGPRAPSSASTPTRASMASAKSATAPALPMRFSSRAAW